MFSHGAGGNGSGYAWFGEYLAAHGYLVAMVYHYRANTFDSSALYVRNRLWQRPGPVSHEIFDNECDQVGRDNYPEACIDAPGVDRARLHEYIENAALKFFDTTLSVQRQRPN